MSIKTIKILLIEDNPGDAYLTRTRLSDAESLGWDLPRFRIERVDTLTKGIARLEAATADKAKAIDAVLTDLDLPDSHAGETFATLRERFPHLPIVVLTGREDEELARASVRAGAQDYLFKNEATGSLLAHALLYAIERQQVLAELQQMHAELERRVEERTADLAGANQDLQRERQNLLNIFAAAPVGMLLLDEETVIVQANETSATMVLREPAEVIGERAGGGLNCIHSREDPRGCGFSCACPTCPLRRGIENALAGEDSIHDAEILLTLLVAGRPEARWLSVSAEPVEIDGRPYVVVAASDITARKRTEQALRESEERFQTIVKALPQFIAYMDKDLKYRFVNQTYQEKFGLEPDQILGKTLPDVIGEAAFEKARSHVERALQGEHVRYHERYEYATGEKRDIDGILVPDLAENGEVRGYYAVLTDITPYMEMQDAFQQSEERLRLLLESTEDIVFMQDLEGRYLYYNGSSKYGLAPEEVVGKTPSDFFDAETAARMGAKRQQVIRTGQRLTVENRVAWQGQTLWFLDEINPIRDKGGCVVAISQISRNITERKQAEEALRASEERFRMTIHRSPIGVGIVDSGGDLTDCNAALAEMVGYSREELLLLNFADFTHPNDLKREWQLINALWEAQTAEYRMEKRYIHKDGHIVWVDVAASLFKGEAGALEFGFAFVQDITERRRTEQERERYAAALQRSNEDLQQFAYTVSHDLKEPLRTVKSFLNLLQEETQGQLDNQSEQFIHFAVDGAERMEQLINALLDYARVDTQGQEPRPTDAEAVLQSVIHNLQLSIEEHRAEISHDPLPTVLVDPTQLGQLFQNLISNALKFCRADGPPHIHISGIPHSSPSSTGKSTGEFWRFGVRDNGIGIAPDQAARLFQVFARLHTREEYDGAGIGLAICKKIVERHGGRIWVASEEGQGSTFYFTLPQA